MSDPDPQPGRARTGMLEVRCAKCGRSTAADANQCSVCGSRLYVFCRKCNEVNLRSATTCEKCGERLHHSVWWKWRRRWENTRPKVRPLEVFLLVVAVYVAYKLIVRLAEY